MRNFKFISKLFICLIASFGLSFAHADNWQTNQRGLQYQMASMSDSDLAKSRQAIEVWQNQTDNLFRRLSDLNVDYSNFNYIQQASEKVSFGIVYSYDASSGSSSGVPISAVSPAGLMQKFGVVNGDIITEINGVSLNNKLQTNDNNQWTAAVKLTKQLKSLSDGDKVKFALIRNNQPMTLQGKITSFKTPLLKVASAKDSQSVAGCGYLTTLYLYRPKTDLHKIQIMSINGKKRRLVNRVKLPPGDYQLEVKELIQNKRLSSSIPIRYRLKTIDLTIEADKQYTLSALFKQGSARDKNNYWQPIVTEEDLSCDN